MFAGRGELKAKARPAQQQPEREDDEGHRHNEDGQDAIVAECRPEPRPGAQGGDHDVVKGGARRRQNSRSPKWDLGVMKKAIAALTMSIAAAGRPAMIGR